jgi:hypothetical protein
VLVVPAWESAPYWAWLKTDEKFLSAVEKAVEFRASSVTFNRAESVFSRSTSMRYAAYKLYTGEIVWRKAKKKQVREAGNMRRKYRYFREITAKHFKVSNKGKLTSIPVRPMRSR